MKSFRRYEIPRDRSQDSYRFHVEISWGHVIDDIWTDDADEVESIVKYAHGELYDARVVRNDGVIEDRPLPPVIP